MGLDMYLFKVHKPTISFDYPVTSNFLDEHNIRYVSKENFDACSLYKQIKPYTKQINIVFQYIDLMKIAKDHGINEKEITYAYVSMYSINKYEFTYHITNDIKKISLSTKEVKEKYVYESIEESYIWEEKEISYWRKCYDLEKFIYQMFDNKIENCGYQILNKEELIKIRDFYDPNTPKWQSDQYELFDIDDVDENAAYFYYEWY